MRDYDPTTERYLQADPLGLIDVASVYGYVKQNPGRYIDPRGEFVWAIPVAVTGAMMLYAYLVWDYCQDHPLDFSGPFWPDWFGTKNNSGGDGTDAGPGQKNTGGGKNDQKRKNTDAIDKAISDAKERLRQATSKPNKTPQDKANEDRIRSEIKRLVDQRRRSENHSMKPKG